ncbi:hypothetical protein FNF31_05370 [Cafeteria roenbergensis]|uniref:Plastocyanin-like domain-containing protein n=1 Tax=Cafeteria roenbergensis TaxID=33653 RepID=A0A5A8D182_CAFRO|nr:hypothetical protein FNF31_05370 [Cafeteria roenbergensis]
MAHRRSSASLRFLQLALGLVLLARSAPAVRRQVRQLRDPAARANAASTAEEQDVAPLGGVVRRVFVDAQVVQWDYFPGGFDFASGVPGENSSHARQLTEFDPPRRMGSRFLKLRFVRFRDAEFRERWPDEPALGLLGFLFHAEVGDRVLFTLRNSAPVAVSAHPHGLKYTKGNEGLPAPGQGPGETADDSIAPGQTFTYTWDAAERSGPTAVDGVSSLGWLIHSHVDEPGDVSAGLVGFVAVTKRGWARPDGSPADVDREFALLWLINDEAKSSVKRQSMAWALSGRGPSAASNVSADEVAAALASASGTMLHAVNGRLFGTLGGIEMVEGERVRWYSAALGDDRDLHTPHWHGGTVLERGARVDTVTLLPATHSTVDMRPDAVGTFLLHCHVDHHMMMGMVANWTVHGCGAEPCAPSDGQLAFERLAATGPAVALPDQSGVAWRELGIGAGAALVVAAAGVLVAARCSERADPLRRRRGCCVTGYAALSQSTAAAEAEEVAEGKAQAGLGGAEVDEDEEDGIHIVLTDEGAAGAAALELGGDEEVPRLLHQLPTP